MERSILQIRRIDKVRNKVIREKTNMKDCNKYINKMKLKWAGHLMRTTDNRWTKKTTEWYPIELKRQRGRPNRRRIDDILQAVGVTWGRKTINRKEWNVLGQAFAQNRVAENYYKKNVLSY